MYCRVSTMDQQAYPSTSVSNFIAFRPRSPSNYRSDSASLLLDSGSIASITDSEGTSAVESNYDTCSENFSGSWPVDSGSSEYLAHSVQTLFSRIRNFNPSVVYPAPYPQDIINATNLLAHDLVIAFIGHSGSGKSNLIDTLTGQPRQRAGPKLESSTTEIRAIRLFNHEIYGDRLVFLDTPAFDDTNKSELEILEMISKWLQKVYENDIKLAGIVYLHRITDNNVVGSLQQNLRMFSELCGDRAMKKVILVTTMWDKVYSSAAGNEREYEKSTQLERDLLQNCWKMMIGRGAVTARFTNSPESAWKFITFCLRHQKADILLMQEELSELKRALNETQAGKTLYSNLQKLLAEQRYILRSLAQQVPDENNSYLVVQLEAEIKRMQMDFDRTFEEIRNLNIPIGKKIMISVSRKERWAARVM